MHCAILSTLYVRANGEVACYDDAGAQIALTHVSADRAFIPEEQLDNHNYRHIRESLREGRVPWSGTCNRCAMLRPDEPFRDLLAERTITTLQVEPTLACALLCPGCTRLVDLKQRRKPHRLTPNDFASLLEGLQQDDYSIGMIEYCGNGEPLNNPSFTDFVRTARRIFPHTKQRVVTNGNFDFDDRLKSVHIDEYMVSCDGAKQGSYEQYRINGEIARVLRFLAAIPADVGGYKQKKIWKYILFDFNDSDNEILLAQSLKQELGVDELVFVRTHSASRSTRFDGDAQLPIATGNVLFDQTPMQHRRRPLYIAASTIAPISLQEGSGYLMVDELQFGLERNLRLRGWYLGPPNSVMSFSQDGEPLSGVLTRNLHRPDVGTCYSAFNDDTSGFEFEWSGEDAAQIALEVEVNAGGTSSAHIFIFIKKSRDAA